jgi:hypothetical protein
MGDALMAAHYAKGLPSAGLFAGPVAWALSTQANYALVPWTCAHQIRVIPVLALVLALVSLAGGFLSWQAYRTSSITPATDSTGGGRPHRFVAAMGIGIACLFALAILVHGTAGLVFHGCER